eukprot:Hpha_TRINITY_DN15084_c0_g1::TRINITY_DN15084_c0_g1_i17::g.124161::m.124161
MSRIMPVDFSIEIPQGSPDPESPPIKELITPEWLRTGNDAVGWSGWKKGFVAGLMIPLCFKMQWPSVIRFLNVPQHPRAAVTAWYTGAAHGTAAGGITLMALLSAWVIAYPSLVFAGAALILYVAGLIVIVYSILWAEFFRWKWCTNDLPGALARVEACRTHGPSKSWFSTDATVCKSVFVRYGMAEDATVKQELDQSGFAQLPPEARDTYHGAAEVANDVLRTAHHTFFFLAFWVVMMPLALSPIRNMILQRGPDGGIYLSTYNAYVWALTMSFPLVFLWPAWLFALAVGRTVTTMRLYRCSSKSGLTQQGMQWELTWRTPVWEKEPPFTLWLIRTTSAHKAALYLLLALAALGKKDPRRHLPRDLLGMVAGFVAAAHTTKSQA